MKSFMEQAQDAQEKGMTEGDYLKVCNALKNAFNAVNTQETPVRFRRLERTKPVYFQLSFKNISGQNVFFSVTETLTYDIGSSDHTYSLRITDDTDVALEFINVTTSDSMIEKLESIMTAHMPDEFELVTDVSKTTYCVEEFIEREHDRVKKLQELGPLKYFMTNRDGDIVDEIDEDFMFTSNPHIIFLKRMLANKM